MSVIFYNDLMYAGGGSSGSGGGTSATVLYDNPNDSSTFTTITLNDAYTNYDAIVMTGCAIAANSTWLDSQIYYVNELKTGDRVGFTDNGAYTWYEVTNSTTLTHIDGAYYLIRCVIGLKFNSGSSQGGVDYSLNEQDTGLKWIDGRTIYQKTIYIQNIGVESGGNAPYSLGLSASDADLIISRESVVTRTSDGQLYIDDAVTPLWTGGSFGIYRWWIDNGQWVVEIDSGYYALQDMYLTIRYVKPLNNN